MDFALTKKQVELRDEVRDFLAKEVTEELARETLSGAGRGPLGWGMYRKLLKKGWITIAWPKEYGGLGGSNVDQIIVAEEIMYSRGLDAECCQAAYVVAPSIMLHGTDEQRKEYLPRIANGEIEFALGYTEPEAGSDIASLKLRAVEDGDYYIISGQKVYNTNCHISNYHWLAARTDTEAPNHKGISMFIVDLKSPGITIRPLWTAAGYRTNEVFYDNVRVPKKNLVGEKNKGFYYMVGALDYERAALILLGWQRRDFDELVKYVKETNRNGKPLSEDCNVRSRLAQLAIDIEIARLLQFRLALMLDEGVIPNYEAAMMKVFFTELTQRIYMVGMKITGPYGRLLAGSKYTPLNGRISHGAIDSLMGTIVGGTSEINKNIIAQRGLGLPR